MSGYNNTLNYTIDDVRRLIHDQMNKHTKTFNTFVFLFTESLFTEREFENFF